MCIRDRSGKMLTDIQLESLSLLRQYIEEATAGAATTPPKKE